MKIIIAKKSDIAFGGEMIMKSIAIAVILFGTSILVGYSKPIEIRHYQYHHRYEFGLRLLELAMHKTNKSHRLIPYQGDINEARGEYWVIKGTFDLQFMSTNRERERQMIPVKIPVYRGLLGMRLLLVKKGNTHFVPNVSWDLSDLRKYTAGHGKFWGDLPVYEANQLPVVPNVYYKFIFEQLKGGRIDYFHRGLVEIWGELERHKNDLKIADDLMIFYKHPVYFFVTKSRPDLAKLIEQGLNKALADGSYKKLFDENFSEIVKMSKLVERKLIILKNPVLPADSPDLDTSWWLPPKFRAQFRKHGI